MPVDIVSCTCPPMKCAHHPGQQNHDGSPGSTLPAFGAQIVGRGDSFGGGHRGRRLRRFRPGCLARLGHVTYIIAEPCIDIKDKSCVDVCPVDCIHEFERMLVIDPEECIDCFAPSE
jgi:Fe-S-cluster-containing dehydrogenase component